MAASVFKQVLVPVLDLVPDQVIAHRIPIVELARAMNVCQPPMEDVRCNVSIHGARGVVVLQFGILVRVHRVVQVPDLEHQDLEVVLVLDLVQETVVFLRQMYRDVLPIVNVLLQIQKRVVPAG